MSTWFDARLIRRIRAYISRTVQYIAACRAVCSSSPASLWLSGAFLAFEEERRSFSTAREPTWMLEEEEEAANIKGYEFHIPLEHCLNYYLKLFFRHRLTIGLTNRVTTRQINQAFNFVFKAHLIFPGCATVRLCCTVHTTSQVPAQNCRFFGFCEFFSFFTCKVTV